MRIGRHLTITNLEYAMLQYINTYKLDVSHLAELLGHYSSEAPVSLIAGDWVEIEHDVETDYLWAGAYVDNMGIFDPENPTVLTFPAAGLYHIFILGYWDYNLEGNRQMRLDSGGYLSFLLSMSGLDVASTPFKLDADVDVETSLTLSLKVLQTSGDVLPFYGANIMISKIAEFV